MIIFAKTFGRNRLTAHISLDEFVSLTGIKKPHVSRTLSSLEERGMILKMSSGAHSIYAVQKKIEDWKSILSMASRREPKDEEVEMFEKWFERYPNQIFKSEAKELYLELIINDDIKGTDLEDALTGYIRYEKYKCEKFKRERDPLMLMYPTTFLKNERWKDFLKFKDLTYTKL